MCGACWIISQFEKKKTRHYKFIQCTYFCRKIHQSPEFYSSDWLGLRITESEAEV